jgi:hypothetical protein
MASGDSSSDPSKPDSGSTDAVGQSRDRLPFEPAKRPGKTKKGNQSASSPPATPEPRRLNPLPDRPNGKKSQEPSQERQPQANRVYSREEMTIPDAVSKRMVRRMAVFCGIPTVIGMSSFVTSYWLNVSGTLEVPNIAVLLLSLGGFGLGVVGLTYGVLSASWEEDQAGTLLGFQEFSLNVGRMTEAWREDRAGRRAKR